MNSSFKLPSEINHKGLFFFGIFFYLITPLIILQTDIFDGLPGIDGWKENVLNASNFIIYVLLVLELLVFFYLGSVIAYKYTNPDYPTKLELGSMSSKIVFTITALFVGFFIFKLRGNAFQGGAGIGMNDDDRLQGILSTSGLLVFYLHFGVSQPKYSRIAFLLLFIITAIFLLGLGGRMYVVIPLVAYFMRSYNQASLKGKSLWPYVFIPIFGALSASILGAIRIGEKLDKLGYFIFAEPVFTSYSAFSFLNQNDIDLIKFPTNFLVSLLNFIPSLIWPSKADVLLSLTGTWVKYDNPLGALSVFVSIYGDFGVILGAVFVFFLGFFFGYVYKGFKTNKINKNLYYCFCGVLPFCFFRDPIGIPIKIFITSFGIIPFTIQMLRQAFKK